MNKSKTGTAIRWTLAVLLAAGGLVQLLWVVRHADDGYSLFGKIMWGLGAMMAGVLLVGPELVGWAVTPLHHMVDNVLMPSESGPPPADYHLAHFYQQQHRYEEACEEYLKIIHYHPEEKTAYLEGITVAAQAGNLALAGKFNRLGKRVLRSADERRLLKGVYDSRQSLAMLDQETEGLEEATENADPAEPGEQAV